MSEICTKTFYQYAIDTSITFCVKIMILTVKKKNRSKQQFTQSSVVDKQMTQIHSKISYKCEDIYFVVSIAKKIKHSLKKNKQRLHTCSTLFYIYIKGLNFRQILLD